MDNIWIILLIVGAVISLTQKNTKRRPQTDSDEEEQPRDVLQKHLEEIFGRGEEHPAAPRPTAMPMPQPPVRKMAQATRRQQQQKPSAIQTQQLRKGSAETPAHHSDNELERIIEEFDMERAVIYSEILKPKYEEY